MFKKALLSILCLPVLLSCSNEMGSRTYSEDSLPASNGGKLDVIVVAKESIWQSVAGERLRKHFTDAQYGLPQPEPSFTVRQVAPQEFNTILERSRNVIKIEKGARNFKIENNQWAKPQAVITLSAPTPEDLVTLIDEYQKKMVSQIKKQEIQVIQGKLAPTAMKNPKVLESHNVSMQIPKSFDIEQEQDNLLVLWNRTLKTDQGIIIHFRPLRDELTTLGSEIIPLRDSLTQLYILGEREGSYMVTEDLLPPQIVPTELAGVFAMETRGLWRVENDFKGGPFINFTVYDEKHNQVIFLDGFIFSPETTKRNFVLELESILRTLKIEN